MSGRAFYGRWARLYDFIARRTPGITPLRRRAVEALELDPGDTVVEMGCGTGANLPLLAEAVGPEGRVIGVDFTRPTLKRARLAVDDAGPVELIHADATAPPLSGPIDAVLGTFVVGMFEDPATVVDQWLELLDDGGRCALLSATRTDRPLARALNLPFRAVVVLSTPPTRQLRYEDDPTARLERRVTAAHDRVVERTDRTVDERWTFGFVRLTAGKSAR